jgi:hypothetical protein
MTFSATFCTKQLSTSINPHFEQSLVPLGWILSNGIQAPQSVASRVLTIPTDSIMHIKLSVCSELAYDLFLGRDWLSFCCRTLPQTSFSPSSGIFCPGNFRIIFLNYVALLPPDLPFRTFPARWIPTLKSVTISELRAGCISFCAPSRMFCQLKDKSAVL